MKNDILVSIIIPLYNKEKVIRKTVSSVLRQSYSNVEVIVVNDGSTDLSVENLSCLDDHRLIIFTKENGGVSSARNVGAKMANGEYILFLDADDTLYPQGVERLINSALENDFPDVVCGGFSISNQSQKKTVSFSSALYNNRVFEHLFKERFYLRMGNFILKNKGMKEEKYFDEQYCFYEDMSFILSAINSKRVLVIKDIIMNYAKENGELSIVPPRLEKDWTYSASFQCRSFYERLIIGSVIGRTMKLRLFNNEYKNAFQYLIKYNVNFYYVCLSFFYRRFNK
ncbi:glycosyltransferase [Vibrio diabolicus]|uniref:Putative glycosyl transferase n=1 Tax=Vibrio parahaemolyticus TaxID=670 RepID=A0A5P5X5F6_VIBPH|nr:MULTISPECIES: glycosyltransferase family 2 protein [Vibrio harveyi group]MBE3892373.1 glycosyltransferase family 2 protein [Vibrio parahaemolyticus]MBE3992427.1 glycosyltransferase family 2 protein [Vibrio parahaemolyticus]MBM5006990.1 glycosyltransferase family 2 protein [Vibrio parahaemolyticus]MCG9229570.1 glycosyltransferase [Vibrio diabolicus]MCG9572001.1 glycosyltransferase [Vibrio diabolicus]